MPVEFSTPQILLVLGVYFVVMLALSAWARDRTDAESFIVSDRDVAFGQATASMGATWIWAASMYAAATAAFTYGVSGAFHYAFWGGLALLFVWKYGQRVRQLVPYGHTLPEFIRVRHGRLSQSVIGLENYVNSQYSLILNFTAGATLVALFSPLSYEWALVILAVTVVSYSALSGIQASIATDVVQVGAMVIVAVVAVPAIVFSAGGPTALAEGLSALGGEEASLFSLQAFLGQGAPMMALILAYAFANPTVWQRIWTVRERQLGKIYITSGVLYMALVFSVGSLGLVALLTGVQPVDGDLNTIVPAVAATYLPTGVALAFLVLVIAAITSTSDSDLAALSSIAMTDIWKGYISRDASDRGLKLAGRLTMVVVAGIAVFVATFRIDILTLILIYGMIRAASVFPIAASIVWDRVSNAGFAAGIIAGIVAGLATRAWSTPVAEGALAGTSTLSRTLVLGAVFIVVSSIGAGTMAGCLAYPFLRIRMALGIGIAVSVAVFAVQVAALPGLLTYNSILSTLTALGVGMLVSTGVSLAGGARFDWNELERRVRPVGAGGVA